MPIMLFSAWTDFIRSIEFFSKKIGNRVYRMSSLLPTVIPVTSHICSKYQVTQYSAVVFIYRFEGWCLPVHIAENEDTLPTISERIFDFMYLKTCFSCKITNY